MSKKETIVLIPSWGMGHIIPFTELAKLFITTTTFSVTIVIFDPPYDVSTSIDPFIAAVTSSHPSISFHRLPKLALPPHYLSDSADIPFSFDLLRFSNPQLTPFLTSLSQTSNIRALILDMFCTAALDVTRELRIPAYLYYSSSVFILASFVALPTIHSRTKNSLKDLGKTPLPLPELPPIPTSYLPGPLLDPENEICKAFVYHCERYPKADGIIVNTFEAIEPKAVKAVNDGLYGTMPPIYCIGPLIADGSSEEEAGEKHVCLQWLDEQPKGSVVFLCFGSMWAFPVEQVKEIALGLERSGQRFLWVVRKPQLGSDPTDKQVRSGKSLDPDLDWLLPEGFVERTEGRGMVVKTWAPQAAVLGHVAVGGFVSHCGWNSILEAVSAGVAIIAWPLYAEQKLNKVFLVEAAKVAVEMEGFDEEVVKGEEVERKVRWLMETEGGKELKERAMGMRECALGARKQGGSSNAAWIDFVQVLRKGSLRM